MRLSDSRVLVTGGTSGIGAELVRQLARAGARVATCGRDPDRLAAVTAHPRIVGWITDLVDPATCARLVDDAVQTWGGLDLVIANAAVQHEQSFIDGWRSELGKAAEAELAVNLLAPMALAAAAMPHLRRSRGSFVAVSSALALSPKRTAPVYCASKSGLSAFLKALRYQVRDAHTGVTVQEAIMPLVATPMTDGRNEGAMPAAQAASHLLEGIQRGRPVIAFGKARLLRIIHRISPATAGRLLRNG